MSIVASPEAYEPTDNRRALRLATSILATYEAFHMLALHESKPGLLGRRHPRVGVADGAKH
jgi:hypothetical protein